MAAEGGGRAYRADSDGEEDVLAEKADDQKREGRGVAQGGYKS